MQTMSDHESSNRSIRAAICGAVILFILLAAAPALASSWWNAEWQYRMPIRFDTTPSGADISENLTGIPVLVRLSTANFNFANSRTDGSDIRFVASDNSTVLKHQIERFDPVNQMALIWVRMERLSGAYDQDFIWIYYGNDSALGGQDAKGVFDNDTVAVFHFDKSQGLPEDSTGYANSAAEFNGILGLPSIIGNGAAFSGGSDRMVLHKSPSLDFSGGFTFSAWVRLAQGGQNARIFSMADAQNALEIGVDGTMAYARVIVEGSPAVETEKTVNLGVDAWHHLAVTLSANGRLSVYSNGLEETWTSFPGDLPHFSSDVVIGGSQAGDRGLAGDLDEVALSSTVRSSAWIRGLERNQRPDGDLLSMGEEELNTTGGLPVFYLATVMRNITLDGWVIIFILIVFAVLSWLVFLTKTFSIWLMQRDNKRFLASLDNQENILGLEGQDEAFANSSIYPLYAAVCRQARASKEGLCSSQDDKGKEGEFSPKATEKIRAALERAYLQQVQKLNAGVVILTMAITGGPFLGLLGTVWGVMNTFAAMAEAGDANIMAIAPGVASALSTTVFGLIVAIPALFAFNYLAAKIRDISADLTLFADEMPLRLQG